MHLGSPVREEAHARGAVVVEAFGVADVLEADGEADAATDSFAASRVTGPTGQPDRLPRQTLGLGYRQGGGLALNTRGCTWLIRVSQATMWISGHAVLA